MPVAQLNIPVGLPRSSVRQALDNVVAAIGATVGSTPEHVSAWVNEVPADLWSAPGPFAQITVLAGRPMEVLQHLVRQATDGVAHALGVRHDLVRVVVSVAQPELWGIGGLPASAVRAEEIAARTRTMG